MSKVVTFACGCSLELDNVDLYVEYAHIELYVSFCEEHRDVRLVSGSDWVRFEPTKQPLPDEEYGIFREA